VSEKYWRLIIFHKGKRIEKRVLRTPDNTKKLVEKVRELRSQDIKCRLVGQTDKRLYPPPRTISPMRDLGKMWCPECGDWSFFDVPKFTPDAPVASEAWYMNSFHNQLIKVCRWCGISEHHWYVKRANFTFGEEKARKRRSSRRANTSRRRSARAR
jgi:hypothetical protein